MTILKMTELDLSGKRVLMREDLNVPITDGRIADDTRIRAALPSIQHAMRAQACVMLMSHLGRPSEGTFEESFSLAPVARRLTELLGSEVELIREWTSGVTVSPGVAVLFENVRFNNGEKRNSDELGQQMAALCDIFVMDAFGTAHRAEASTYSVAKYAPIACAGPLLAAELDALGRAIEHPARPVVAMVGGSKVSTKLTVLKSLCHVVDRLIVGGGIANTFILAAGHNIGKSLAEPELIGEANVISEKLKAKGGSMPIAEDVVCAKEFSKNASASIKLINEVEDDDMILDIGPKTRAQLATVLADAGTIIWNGPVGAFEFDQFGSGTRAVARAVAQSSAYSLVGGGDTIAALAKYGVSEQISYISTGGGAFLEFIEGKKLPAVEILEARARMNSSG